MPARRPILIVAPQGVRWHRRQIALSIPARHNGHVPFLDRSPIAQAGDGRMEQQLWPEEIINKIAHMVEREGGRLWVLDAIEEGATSPDLRWWQRRVNRTHHRVRRGIWSEWENMFSAAGMHDQWWTRKQGGQR